MKMKTLGKWCWLFFLLGMIFPLSAEEYVVKGGQGEPMLAKEETSLKLKVYVVNGTEGVSISYTSTTSSHQWYRYKTKRLEAEPIACEQQGTTSTITQVEDGYGYFVEEGPLSSYVWIIDYSKHPFEISNLAVSDDSDPCSGVILTGNYKMDNLTYSDPTSGINRQLNREFEVSYESLEWDEEAKVLNSVEKVKKLEGNPFQQLIDSVYADTNFTLTGDQFASHFGKPQSATTDFYETSSVLLQADTTVFLEAAENMTTTSEALSAPVTIRFTAYANEPVASLYIWKIYKTEEGADNALIRFTEPEVEYTFSEYGKYTAEVEVSDRTGKCYASYPFEIEVAESFLDVPNAFSPGTTPGVNDEFRVAYKSLVKFSCWIFNRWGQQIYHWTNPAEGWDGKKGGKYVAPGVYFYVIEAEGSDGIKYKKKGDINILRPKKERNFDSSGSGSTEM